MRLFKKKESKKKLGLKGTIPRRATTSFTTVEIVKAFKEGQETALAQGDESTKAPRELKVGDRVRIVDVGSYGGFENGSTGIFLGMDLPNRAEIDIEGYSGKPLGFWLNRLEHEDGTPVKLPDEDSSRPLMPLQFGDIGQAAETSRISAEMFALALAGDGSRDAWINPIQILRERIEKDGLEAWAHENLQHIERLDESPHGTLYQYTRNGFDSSNPMRFVMLTGNIGQKHWLFVPPWCKTAEQAVAWTFGMLPGEYHPMSEA